MITSKEVFAKRREGAIDEAYQMALELMGAPQVSDWDGKAFCWCLIDLIKRDTTNGNQQSLLHYRRQLESIEVNPSDDVLIKAKRNALSLSSPGGEQISHAKALSKEGRHSEAVAAYRNLSDYIFTDREIQTGFGWELYKHSKSLMAAENVNLGSIKRNLNDYLKLDVEKPSLLHTCMLQLAAKLTSQDKFNMLVFSRMWNLDYLRDDDFKRYQAEDGKEYPSLAEKVIQQASKEAATSDNTQDQKHILSYIDIAIEHFPDNIWLKLNKTKILLSLGLHSEALTFGLYIAKAKSNDYWSWGLLGDIVSRTDQKSALGCYCKALSCPTDDKFTGKIKLHVARHMLECGDFAAAKREIESIVHSKESNGHKIPEDVAEIVSQPWYADTQASVSNQDFYYAHIPAAEALLYNDLPWIEACVGDTYTTPGKEDKPRRKLYLKTSSIPTEVSIHKSKFGRKNLAPGDAVMVKGEFDDNQRFHIFVLENRESESSWDVFSETIGVIDHVNNEKLVLHFIVDRKIDGVVPFSKLSKSFAEGDAIAVRLSKYVSKHGPMYRVHQVRATDKQPDSHIKKPFCEEVRISNGMGFTESDIFVSPKLVARHGIEGGQTISGTAVLNFNKKHRNWGWKAVSLTL